MNIKNTLQRVTVLVPMNPFVAQELQNSHPCLAVLDVEKLMEWWPGKPHIPERDLEKVRAIQRSLDWKRVVQIAAYLLQREIVGAPEKLNKYFYDIYEPNRLDPGREWPPKVPKVVGFQRSEYPIFSSVLLHVNGAKVEARESDMDNDMGTTANLTFDEDDQKLNFSVIDGQHRINGAYLAVCLLKEEKPETKSWQIPAEIFIDLDPSGEAPRRQAQIFIDINFYQKKVDRSLVDDLFPTARGARDPLNNKERAQDLGRKLMLEVGPLIGMIQIPGIKFGVPDVVALSTLNSAIEDQIDVMNNAGIASLDSQAEFIAQCLEAWLNASGRKEDIAESPKLDPENVAYQGRVLVSFLTLIPWCIWHLKNNDLPLISQAAQQSLADEILKIMQSAGLMKKGKFLAKGEFVERKYLGSGGLALFRDTLWAAIGTEKLPLRSKPEDLAKRAEVNQAKITADLIN